MARYLALLMVGLMANLSFAVLAIAGEVLPDPTRPPAALIKSAAAGANGTEAEEGASASALQSVILRKGHKPVAIIGGERVELGGVYGGARVINITESKVVLHGPSGRETLLLTPAVQKKTVIEANKPAKVKASLDRKVPIDKKAPTDKKTPIGTVNEK